MRRLTALLTTILLTTACTGEDVPLSGEDAATDDPVDAAAIDAAAIDAAAIDAAVDAPLTYTLTVVRAGTGTGVVDSAPAGITCGATCAASYPTGAVVTLTATPTGGSVFVGWSGACSGTGACVVSAAATVTATFAPSLDGLIVTRSGNGSGVVVSSPAGINCGADCTESYPPHAIVTLAAVPNSGSIFLGWSGGGCTGTGTCNVTVDGTVTVDAMFSLGQFTLTVVRDGTGTGSVAGAPGPINCGAICAAVYLAGTAVTLTAVPTAGSTFTGWSFPGCAAAATCTVVVNAPITVGATFTAN